MVRIMHFDQKTKRAMIAATEHGTMVGATGQAVGGTRKTNLVRERTFMADLNSRLPQNAPGAWYVDSNCIDCDLCRETAPTVFRRDEDGGYSIVFHQPETEEERKLAAEAKEGCPVEAIGDDGPPAGAL
jgi:ferredoxin